MAANIQYQVRENNEELQDYLKDLYKWEDEVQAKDKLLANSKLPADPVSSLTPCDFAIFACQFSQVLYTK